MATVVPDARGRAFERLYRRYVGDVYRYALAVLRNPADAEDVTQTTFLNAYRAYQRGERPQKPVNWLISIAHNVCRQRFRQAQRRPHEVEYADEVSPAIEESDGPTAEDLRRAFSHLPPNQRAALVMRELEGRSYAEIAEVLGITVSALETLLFRARRSLAEELESLVTCARAEEDVSRLLDGRLSRRERRRLLEHVRTCPSCARFEAFQRKQRRALKGLALLPLPASLMLFKGAHAASAAALPTIGAGVTGVSVTGAGVTGAGVTAAATGGGAASGGFAIGGLAVTGTVAKVAAVVAAAVVAGGVSYEGVQIADAGSPKKPAVVTTGVSDAGKKRGTVRPVVTTRPAHAGEGKTRGKSAAAHERKPKLVRVAGRHHVPGGLLDTTGTPNANGNGGGPATGNANGDATRAHGTPSGSGANGRGAGSTKTSSSTSKAKTPAKTKTASGKSADHVTTNSGKASTTDKKSAGSTDTSKTTVPATNDTTPNGNADANGAANGNPDPGTPNGTATSGSTPAPADHGNDKK